MNIFPIGIGIDLSDTHVRVAKVSYFGRVLESEEKELPIGLVVDDKVMEPEKLNFFLKKTFFDKKQSFRSRVAILIPESRVFRCTLRLPKEKKNVSKQTMLSLVQRDIPFPFSQMHVLIDFSLEKDNALVKVEAVERELIENLTVSVPQENNRLIIIEARSRAFVRMMHMRGLLPSGFFGLIDMNEGWVTITVFQKQQIVYSRAIRHDFSFVEKQKNDLSNLVDFVINILDEIVLYFQEEDKMIDNFILSGSFFIDQTFQGLIKTRKGKKRVEFIEGLFSSKEKKLSLFFFGGSYRSSFFHRTIQVCSSF